MTLWTERGQHVTNIQGGIQINITWRWDVWRCTAADCKEFFRTKKTRVTAEHVHKTNIWVMTAVLTSWWPIDVNLIYWHLDLRRNSDRKSSSTALWRLCASSSQSKSQISRGPSPSIATVKYHRKEMHVHVYACMGVLRSRKLCARVPGVGVGLLKCENPAACKTQRSAILASTVMCQNVRGVSDQNVSAAHNARARPCCESNAVFYVISMFMQWKGLDCVEVDGSGAEAVAWAGMACTHLALITIFQKKLDCWREHSIYI